MRDRSVTSEAMGESLPAEPERKAAPARATETIEEWSRRKGMADRFLATTGAFPLVNPAYQDFAQARAHASWAAGTRVSEEDFDAAVSAAKNHEFR